MGRVPPALSANPLVQPAAPSGPAEEALGRPECDRSPRGAPASGLWAWLLTVVLCALWNSALGSFPNPQPLVPSKEEPPTQPNAALPGPPLLPEKRMAPGQGREWHCAPHHCSLTGLEALDWTEASRVITPHVQESQGNPVHLHCTTPTFSLTPDTADAPGGQLPEAKSFPALPTTTLAAHLSPADSKGPQLQRDWSSSTDLLGASPNLPSSPGSIPGIQRLVTQSLPAAAHLAPPPKPRNASGPWLTPPVPSGDSLAPSLGLNGTSDPKHPPDWSPAFRRTDDDASPSSADATLCIPHSYPTQTHQEAWFPCNPQAHPLDVGLTPPAGSTLAEVPEDSVVLPPVLVSLPRTSQEPGATNLRRSQSTPLSPSSMGGSVSAKVSDCWGTHTEAPFFLTGGPCPAWTAEPLGRSGMTPRTFLSSTEAAWQQTLEPEGRSFIKGASPEKPVLTTPAMFLPGLEVPCCRAGTTSEAPNMVPMLPLQFRLMRITYSPLLMNPRSTSFLQLHQEVVLTFRRMLSSMPGFREIHIVSFYQGSVWVQSKVEVQGQPPPTSSDLLRTVATKVHQHMDTYFSWHVDLASLSSNGYTLEHLEPEKLLITFMIPGISSLTMEKTILNLMNKLKNQVVECLDKLYPVGDFNFIDIWLVSSHLWFQAEVQVQSQALADIPQVLQVLTGLAKQSVELSSLTVAGSQLNLTILPISLSILNKRFIDPLKDIASSAYQDLARDIAALVQRVLSPFPDLLQVLVQGFQEDLLRKDSLVYVGELVFPAPGPAPSSILQTLVVAIQSDGHLAGSPFQVDPISLHVAEVQMTLQPATDHSNLVVLLPTLVGILVLASIFGVVVTFKIIRCRQLSQEMLEFSKSKVLTVLKSSRRSTSQSCPPNFPPDDGQLCSASVPNLPSQSKQVPEPGLPQRSHTFPGRSRTSRASGASCNQVWPSHRHLTRWAGTDLA